jgi:hypothetical protein
MLTLPYTIILYGKISKAIRLMCGNSKPPYIFLILISSSVMLPKESVLIRELNIGRIVIHPYAPV